MKLVTFSRATCGHGAGDRRLVPDALAIQLEKDKAISSAISWPPAADDKVVTTPTKPQRPILRPGRPTGTPDNRLVK